MLPGFAVAARDPSQNQAPALAAGAVGATSSALSASSASSTTMSPAQILAQGLTASLFASPPASPPFSLQQQEQNQLDQHNQHNQHNQLSSSPPLGNLFATCRNLQAALQSAPTLAPSSLAFPALPLTPPQNHHYYHPEQLTPPLTHATPPLKLRLRSRKASSTSSTSPSTTSNSTSTTTRKRIVKRAPPARGPNKRRRAVDDDMGRGEEEESEEETGEAMAEPETLAPPEPRNVLRSGPFVRPALANLFSSPAPAPASAPVGMGLGLASAMSLASSSGSFSTLLLPPASVEPTPASPSPQPRQTPPSSSASSPRRPQTPKRARIAPEALPLGLARSDFHTLHADGIPDDSSKNTHDDDVDEEADGEFWSTEEDRMLVELVLEKLQLSKSDWQDCARSLGKKDRHSVGRRWKSLMLHGDIGLRRSRRARIHGTWR